MKKHFWWVTAVALVLALVGQFLVYYNQKPMIAAHASWAFQPNSFQEVVNEARTIVTGRVESVQKGPDIVVEAKGEPTGQDVIPTEQITFRVNSAQKGNVGRDQVLTVFRTGGEVTIPQGPAQGSIAPGPETSQRATGPEAAQGQKGDPNGPAPEQPAAAADPNRPATAQVKVFLLAEDPAYQVGQTYMLALTEGPNNTHRPVAPEGRLMVNADGSVSTPADSEVGQGLNGRQLAQLQAAAQGRENIPPPAGAKRRVSTGGNEPSVGMPTTGHGHDIDNGPPYTLYAAIAMACMAVAYGVVTRLRTRKVREEGNRGPGQQSNPCAPDLSTTTRETAARDQQRRSPGECETARAGRPS
ncbi:MAG TPA: hypothetical protein VFR15_06500 [Chloroflexia bacterium]|nr:hypothetical protein [Chloroflexia bacterium]